MDEEYRMSNLQLTEVQRYFDDKISDTKDVIHSLDKKVFGIEKDIKAINSNIQDLKNEIPNIIEKSLSETKNKKKENSPFGELPKWLREQFRKLSGR